MHLKILYSLTSFVCIPIHVGLDQAGLGPSRHHYSILLVVKTAFLAALVQVIVGPAELLSAWQQNDGWDQCLHEH